MFEELVDAREFELDFLLRNQTIPVNAGAQFSWLERMRVAREAAGSRLVAAAISSCGYNSVLPLPEALIAGKERVRPPVILNLGG